MKATMNYNMGLLPTQSGGRSPTRQPSTTRGRRPSMTTMTIAKRPLFTKKVVTQNRGFPQAKKMLQTNCVEASKTNQTMGLAMTAQSPKRGRPIYEVSKLDKSIATVSGLIEVKLKNKAGINRTVFWTCSLARSKQQSWTNKWWTRNLRGSVRAMARAPARPKVSTPTKWYLD